VARCGGKGARENPGGYLMADGMLAVAGGVEWVEWVIGGCHCCEIVIVSMASG
jgi:hypothetical protein